MLDNIKKRKESGFTIVEVMIVLAIAGLIILVVFLAVPALQRNARNTERNNDASLVGSAVNECLLNRNGVVAQCGQAGIALYLDTNKLRQLTDVQVAVTAPAAGDLDTVNIAFGRKCDAAGAAATATGATPRSVALLFNTENATGANSGTVTRCQEV